MAKPTWDDTEEIEDIPSFDDTMDIADDIETEKPSMLESAGRGAVQGTTLGFGEELGAAALTPLEALRRKISSLIPGTSENVDAELREQGFELPEEKGVYSELRDTAREADKAAKEESPWIYGGAEIAGGILPALATGGGSAAAGAAGLTKEGLKQAAKLGAGYGAASGAGLSEADLTEGDVAGLAADTALGGVIGAGAGAALPVIGKGVKTLAGKLGRGVGKTIDTITPESEAIKAGYSYGREGKALTEDVVYEDMKNLSKDIINKLSKAKNSKSLKNIKKDLDAAGIKVNTKEAIETTIDDLKKIAQDDILEISDQTLLPKLQKLAGINVQAQNLAGKAEKAALKKAIESQGKAQQAIMKGEKKLAQDAVKSGDDLMSVQDIKRSMDDMELPFDTSKGQIGGAKGKFQGPEGEYTKQVLSDVTDYQPEISKILGPDGRPVVKTTDLGSGKITALVGDIENKIQKDLSNLTVSEVESLRKQLNVVTDLAKSQGTAKDPVVARARQLAVELRDLTNKAVEASGDDQLTAARQRMSDLLSAEDLLGVSKTKAIAGPSAEAEKIRNLADKLGFRKGFKTGDEAKEAFDKVGEEVISSTDKARFDRFKQLNAVMGRESQENVSRAGLYKKLVGDIPNIAGRAVKKVEDKLVSPVISAKKAVTDLTDDQLASYGSRLATSENKGLQDIGQKLIDAAGMEGAGKQQLLWSLSQSPAMRELIERLAGSVEQDEQEMLNYSDTIEVPEQGETQEVSSVDMPESFSGDRSPNNELSEKLGKRESGNDYKAVNQLGYLGKYQFGGMALQDLGYKDTKGKWVGKDGINSKEDFLDNPEAQEKAFKEWEPRIKGYLKSKGALKYVGQDFNGIPVTEEGLLAAAHLVGAQAVIKMLKSGEIPQDANGTKATDYMKMFAPKEEQVSEPVDEPVIETPSEVEIDDISRSIDMTNQMQSSGDNTPVDQLDALLAKINMLNLPEEQIDDLEEDAVNMTGYRDGLALKEKIIRLIGA